MFKTLFALLLIATVSSLTVFADNSVSASTAASADFVKSYTAPAPTAKTTGTLFMLLPIKTQAPQPLQMACINPKPPIPPDPNCGDWPPPVAAVLRWLGLA